MIFAFFLAEILNLRLSFSRGRPAETKKYFEKTLPNVLDCGSKMEQKCWNKKDAQGPPA